MPPFMSAEQPWSAKYGYSVSAMPDGSTVKAYGHLDAGIDIRNEETVVRRLGMIILKRAR